MIPDPPIGTGEPVYRELFQSAVGLADAAQNFDGNGRYVRANAGGGDNRVTTPSLPGGGPCYGNAVLPTLGTRPAFAGSPPPVRRDVACYKNARPQLNQVKTGRAREARDPDPPQDFIAILALVVLAGAVVVYILDHQPSFTLGKSYYTVKAQFASGAAVTSGQGQSVDVAGVQIGQVGAVDLEGGRAVVTMNIYKKYQPIYRNATVLLRPRTPLKDMYLSLDPGTATRARSPTGERSRSRTPPRRQRRGDPVLPGRRHAQLPAAAARRRGAAVPRRLRQGRGAQPEGGLRPAGHVQAVRAAQPGHEDVYVAAGAADKNIRRSIHNLQEGPRRSEESMAPSPR